MAKVRILIASNENGSKQEVFFTGDFETPAEDFFMGDLTVSSDTVCECNLPHNFPMEYNLSRL